MPIALEDDTELHLPISDYSLARRRYRNCSWISNPNDPNPPNCQ
jgi:hypothetical protein